MPVRVGDFGLASDVLTGMLVLVLLSASQAKGEDTMAKSNRAIAFNAIMPIASPMASDATVIGPLLLPVPAEAGEAPPASLAVEGESLVAKYEGKTWRTGLTKLFADAEAANAAGRWNLPLVTVFAGERPAKAYVIQLRGSLGKQPELKSVSLWLFVPK